MAGVSRSRTASSSKFFSTLKRFTPSIVRSQLGGFASAGRAGSSTSAKTARRMAIPSHTVR